MQQEFHAGDLAVVRSNEGLDTPPKARGKLVRIVQYLGDSQYTVRGQDGLAWCACDYHLQALPQVIRLDLPNVQVVKLLELDPDLYEHVVDAQKAIPELLGFSLVTVLFTMAWLGYDELQRNSRVLRGSGIREVIK